MTDLEKYFKAHAGQFDDLDLPEGHEDRFLAKLEAVESEKQAAEADSLNRRRLGRLKLVLSACAAAAAVAILLIINIPSSGSRSWYAQAGSDPVEVYRAYTEKAASICSEIYSSNMDPNVENAVQSLTQEPVIMLDQLPDEMSDAEKSEILKEYYGKILNGLEHLK